MDLVGAQKLLLLLPRSFVAEQAVSAAREHQNLLGPLCRRILDKKENALAAEEDPPEYIQRKIFVLCVGGRGAEEIDLLHCFSDYGEIEQGPIWVYNDNNNNLRVCSFLYKTIDSADNAVKGPRKNYQGCALCCCQKTIDRPTLIMLVPSILDKRSTHLPQSPEPPEGDWCRNISLCESATVYLSILHGLLVTQIARIARSNNPVYPSTMRGFSSGAPSSFSSSSSSSMQERSSRYEILPTGGGPGRFHWPHGSIGGNNTRSISEDPAPVPTQEPGDLEMDFVMVTHNNEVNPDSSSLHAPNTVRTANRCPDVGTGDSFTKAIREMLVATDAEYNKRGTSLSRRASSSYTPNIVHTTNRRRKIRTGSTSFSIGVCMEEMKKHSDIPMAKRLKATKELQDVNWRETFMCMDEEMRRAWLESLE